MAIQVGINGFGRIGRLVLRSAINRPENFDICGINYRNADLDHMVYMIKYDTVFGRFQGDISRDEQHIIINGHKIRVFSEEEASKIPWRDCGAEYIVESTGAYTTEEKASQHLIGGARKVVITAPAKDKSPTFVMGVNHTEYKPDMTVVSNASCTTNCLAPLVKVVHAHFGIEQGLMSTIHSTTAKQKTVDSRTNKDWRVGRSVLGNIIPSTTGAAKACALVIPEMKGKLTGMSFRVPTADVSVVDLTARLSMETTYDAICEKVKEAAETYMRGIIGYIDDAVVSTDFIGDMHTCLFDSTAGIMLGGNFVKLIAWYDNEWGYSNKVLDLIGYMHEVDYQL